METEKLYSPLNFYIRDKEEAVAGQYDDVDYWRDAIGHEEAFGYMDAIELTLRRDRDRMDGAHGLAEYVPASLDDLVVSFIPNIELHGDRLWCVADIALSRPITPGEMGELTQWWEGQLSDGWGESLEQREIKVDRGDLYVEPWTPDVNFFIATQAEFDRRLGIEQPMRETPAQAALHEPDIYDDEATAALRETLIERLNDNLSDYFTELRGMYNEEITGMSSEIGAKMDAHYYLTEIHNFHTSELNYLLLFQNPLEVVADEFLVSDTDRSDTMWSVFDRQDALQGDYSLVTDMATTQKTPSIPARESRDDLMERIARKHCRVETLEERKRDSLDFHEVSVWGLKAALVEAFDAGVARQKAMTATAEKEELHTDSHNTRDTLFARLDKNLSDYCEGLMDVDKREVIGMAEEIATWYAAREYLKTGYDFKTGEVEYLLQFQDPLALVANRWPGTLDGLVPMDGVVADILEDRSSHGHYVRVVEPSSPASKESTRDASAEKPSVLDKIREAARAPKEPHKEKPAREKSGPEL